MNDFTLFAHGEDFDVDAYLRTTSLEFDYVWRRGEQKRYSCVDSPYKTSGVEKVLGIGWQTPIHEQDRIATEFLEANETKLMELAQFPGVEHVILGLHDRIELTPSICGFSMSLSPRLMYFALRIGVVPTFYVDLQRKDESDDGA